MDTKNRLFVLIFLAVILSLFTVQAAVEITENSINFEVDYNNFDDESQIVVRKTIEFTVRNTEFTPVLIKTSVTGLSSRYNVPAINQINIPAGETRIITFNIDVPHQQSSGERQIGTIVIKDTNDIQYDSVSLNQDTKSMISIDELRVDYEDKEGNSEQQIFDEGDNKFTLRDRLQPGSEIILKFNNIKNEFDNNYDSDYSTIESLTLILDPSDNDLFDDFDETYDLDDLEAGQSDDLTITLLINNEVDEGSYTVQIELEGEDGQGVKHSFTRDLDLRVERSNDDVRITKFEILPSETIEACETNVRINVEIKNFGSDRQRESALLLFSDTLGIVENIPNIELNKYTNSDNNYKRTFNFNFNRKNVENGKHRIDVSAFVNSDEQADLEHKLITLTECTNSVQPIVNNLETNNQQQVDDKVITNSDKVNEEKISSGTIVRTIEDPYTSEDVLVALIVISMILILAVIAIFTMILVRTISEVPKK